MSYKPEQRVAHGEKQHAPQKIDDELQNPQPHDAHVPADEQAADGQTDEQII